MTGSFQELMNAKTNEKESIEERRFDTICTIWALGSICDFAASLIQETLADKIDRLGALKVWCCCTKEWSTKVSQWIGGYHMNCGTTEITL